MGYNFLADVRMPNIADTYYRNYDAGREEAAQNAQGQRANALAQAKLNKPQGMSWSQHLGNQGFIDEGMELDKAQGEIDKGQAETGKINAQMSKEQAEAHLKDFEVGGQVAQSLLEVPEGQLNKQYAMNHVMQLGQQGLLRPEQVQGFESKIASMGDDDASIRNAMKQLQMQSVASKDALQLHLTERGQDITMRGQDITQQHNLASEGIDRDRLNLDAGYKSAQVDIDRQKLGLDERKHRDSLMPGKSGKPPTEFQGKSALYANRAQEAENILSTIDYSPAAIGTKSALSNTPVIGGVLGAGANAMMSERNQKAEQAQRNFVNAILRQESGAVISEQEFENAKKQYFPAVGDSDAVKAQKAENRRVAIQSLKNNAEGVIDTGITGKSARPPKPEGATDAEWDAFLKAKGL